MYSVLVASGKSSKPVFEILYVSALIDLGADTVFVRCGCLKSYWRKSGHGKFCQALFAAPRIMESIGGAFELTARNKSIQAGKRISGLQILVGELSAYFVAF